MGNRTFPRTPTDLRTEGIAMSSEIDYRVGSLLAEADNRRLFAGAGRAGLRRRLGHLLIAAGRGIEGRAAVEPVGQRTGQPTAGVRA
jgi:hypothetical protein